MKINAALTILQVSVDVVLKAAEPLQIRLLIVDAGAYPQVPVCQKV
jgi:hypothetical protein